MSPPNDVQVRRGESVGMRDGIELATDVYVPSGEGPWPVLLMRLPYGRTQAQMLPGMYDHPTRYAREGYVVVVQDTRGRFDSEGEFTPFVHEATDSYDTIEWAASLEESTGEVGMYGFSYVGTLQVQAAAEQPPSLTCTVPGLYSTNLYEMMYRGGAFSLAFIVSWLRMLAIDAAQRRGDDDAMAEKMGEMVDATYADLPLGEFPGLEGFTPYFYDWVEHDTYDEYWRDIGVESECDAVEVPGLHVGGWYDTFLDGTIGTYQRLVERTDRPQKLLVYPWRHTPWTGQVGALDFGEAARNTLDREQRKWFDYWLKGEENGYLDEPDVKLFVMGANTWREAERWPPADVEYETFYLHSDGDANVAGGNGSIDHQLPGDEPPDIYAYDPRNPVVSVGGRSCCDPDLAPMGPADQRQNYPRKDVLLYTSDELSEPVEVTGPVSTTLTVSSTVPDTDFVVKLIDVHPDGRAINVAEGVLRMRFRNSFTHPEPLEPGEAYEIDVDLVATSNLFDRGHHIQLYVSSSDYPQYDRNPNTGAATGAYTETDFTTATQTIYHDEDRPSHVTLPIVRPPISE